MEARRYSWLEEANKAVAMVKEEDHEEESDEEEEVVFGLGFGENGRKRGGGRPAAEAFSRKKAYGGGVGGRLAVDLCQADNCTSDLTASKPYYRRHKVCEVHARASLALISGSEKRFCQQCSRFHNLSEFDDTKRSCRRRLAGHNERRRKSSLFESR